MKEVPVYLFLGFLESGKTKFIQETMEDERFDSGENTLLLVNEEGEEEYNSSRFAVRDFEIEYVGTEELTLEKLTEICKKHDPDRAVVELNGMVELNTFFEAMPDGWMINQVMTFFDSRTFLSVNRNMRQLVYDKLQFTDMVVFNRFQKSDDKLEFHKIVRGASRRPDIVYEYVGGEAEYDDIEDPLPFDINADVIEIEDRDYAFFYRDLMEDMGKYEGKKVRFKGLVATDKRLGNKTIVVGRHIMTCCEADIRYSGMLLISENELSFRTRDWVSLEATIHIQKHKVYGGEGPVLFAAKISKSEPPEQELATFY